MEEYNLVEVDLNSGKLFGGSGKENISEHYLMEMEFKNQVETEEYYLVEMEISNYFQIRFRNVQ